MQKAYLEIGASLLAFSLTLNNLHFTGIGGLFCGCLLSQSAPKMVLEKIFEKKSKKFC